MVSETSTLFDLPEAPRTIFERPPLVLALCQVQFPTTLSVADFQLMGAFQRAIREEYLIAKPAHQLRLQLGLAPSETEFQQTLGLMQWTFSDNEDNWVAVLNANFLTLETRAYASFDDFIGRLRRLLDAVVFHIQPAVCTRIGLRYINEIRSVGLPWNGVIRPELLGVLGNREVEQYIVQAVQELNLQFPEHQQITIRHGRFPGGTTVRHLAGGEATTVPFYLLDFDVFREYPKPTVLRMDPEPICRQVQDFHENVHRLFHWSVSEQYLSTLGVRDGDGN